MPRKHFFENAEFEKNQPSWSLNKYFSEKYCLFYLQLFSTFPQTSESIQCLIRYSKRKKNKWTVVVVVIVVPRKKNSENNDNLLPSFRIQWKYKFSDTKFHFVPFSSSFF